MSKLAERIRKASRAEGPPIGFGAGGRKPAPTMLLLARYFTDEADRAKEAIHRGADVLLFQGDASRLRGKLQELEQATVGLHLAALDAKAVTDLKQMGLDFAVFAAEASAAEALLDQQFGFVLALDRDLTDVVLRVLESLPLDALLVSPLEGPLTVQRQLELKRLFLLSRTPLLMEVRPDFSPSHLRCLRDAGIVGVIAEASAGHHHLSELRQAIDRLPPPRRGRGREERAEAILPTGPIAAAAPEEEEE